MPGECGGCILVLPDGPSNLSVASLLLLLLLADLTFKFMLNENLKVFFGLKNLI